jgi:hypothetical protein
VKMSVVTSETLICVGANLVKVCLELDVARG